MSFVQMPLAFRARVTSCENPRRCREATSAQRKPNSIMTKIAILGGSGYTGLELLKILLRHPHLEIIAVTSRQEGTPLVCEAHPCLTGRINLRMEPFDAANLVARGVECAFGCLPHGVSMECLP